jgi:hypothetical protein
MLYIPSLNHSPKKRNPVMTTFRHTPAPAVTAASADSLLRDMAFVLRMTRKVKTEMIAERATAASNEPETYSQTEPEVCAI